MRFRDLLNTQCRLASQIQEWFQEDFSDVSINRFSSSETFAPLGRATVSEIFLSGGINNFNRSLLLPVLIHELAHVVQKRRGAGQFRKVQADQMLDGHWEREAHFASIAFFRQQTCPALSADPFVQPRSWGPAGHFYTVYWLARVAGMSDADAEMLAFFAQMPDQISDLDAATQGLDFWFWKPLETIIAPAFPIPISLCSTDFNREDYFQNYVYAIQAGLHCLNGRSADEESKRRIGILKKLPNDKYLIFSFGLGSHALGDSYAHRTEAGRTFAAPGGHALAGKNFDEVILKYGTEIDNLCKEPVRYNDYCLALLGVILDRFGPVNISDNDRKRLILAIGKNVTQVTDQPRSNGQISILSSFFSDRSSTYKPEEERCQKWPDFYLCHSDILSLWMHEKAQELASSWTVSPG